MARRLEHNHKVVALELVQAPSTVAVSPARLTNSARLLEVKLAVVELEPVDHPFEGLPANSKSPHSIVRVPAAQEVVALHQPPAKPPKNLSRLWKESEGTLAELGEGKVLGPGLGRRGLAPQSAQRPQVKAVLGLQEPTHSRRRGSWRRHDLQCVPDSIALRHAVPGCPRWQAQRKPQPRCLTSLRAPSVHKLERSRRTALRSENLRGRHASTK